MSVFSQCLYPSLEWSGNVLRERFRGGASRSHFCVLSINIREVIRMHCDGSQY